MTNNHWIIVATGTGGHVFPGIAIAKHAIQIGVKITWIGTPLARVRNWVSKELITFETIDFVGVRRTNIMNWLLLPYTITKALVQSILLLIKLRPNVVVCMGGYISFPVGIATKLLGIKLVIHEQNSVAGKTNQFLATIANEIYTGFGNVTFNNVITCKAITHNVYYVGNPVRAGIKPKSKSRIDNRHSSFNVLIIGGSSGAVAINKLLFDLYRADYQQFTEVNFIHQTGEAYFPTAQKILSELGDDTQKRVTITPFIDDIGAALQNADMIISRAGAISVSEIHLVSVPALLIPYPYAVDNHQQFNAQFLVDKGGAICFTQQELTVAKLADTIIDEFMVLDKWNEKFNILSNSRKQNSATEIVSRIKNLINER